MPDASSEPSLWEESHLFAERLNYLMDAVLPGDLPLFRAEERREELVVVSIAEPFSLFRLGSTERFAFLDVYFRCVWSSQKPILAVTKSEFMLRDTRGGIPVLHLDYVRDTRSKHVPVAHYNVASQHRLLRNMADPENLAQDENQRDEVTRKLHLPVGEHRFRPALEDLLTMLISDLKVQRKPGWEDHVQDGRGVFREMQTAAAVRDHPGKAVEELERMGYDINWPEDRGADPGHHIREERFYRY